MGYAQDTRIFKDQNGGRKAMHSELWHACAGPLVSLPQVGSLVYYFPQGHSEQVAVSTKRSATSHVPNYPNLPSQLLCQALNVTLHADRETDEIFAQMSLQPIKSENDVFHVPDFGMQPSKHPTEFFCKTLTASDTSTHGGFSVPRRAAEKLFPQLDFNMQPPSQELVVRDLHDNTWTFRHIYRGQPKRHLLTTGWSVFVGSKRLKAGDSVLVIRDEKSQLLIGVRRAKRQQTTLPSSVLSADSMHIGVLAAAAHAAANRSPFTVFYNPRACPSEFVIPVNKYRKSVFDTQISVGMRFGMMFETDESGKRRYTGSVVGASDLDPIRWSGSKWRSLQVEWDEPGCHDKPNRVSPWDIETPESPFLFPALTSGFKRSFASGYFGGESEWGSLAKRPSIPSLYSEELIRTLFRPQTMLSNADNRSVVSCQYNCQTSLDAEEPKKSNKDNINEDSQISITTENNTAGLENHTTSMVMPIQEQDSLNCIQLPDMDIPDWLPNIEPLVDLSDDTHTQSEVYSTCIELDGATTNDSSAILDPSVSNSFLADFPDFKDADFQYSLMGNFNSIQDLHFPDTSGTSNVDFDSSWQQVNPIPNPPMRTFTKVQKAGSVGRSIDVTVYKNYDELRSAIERMFGLDGVLSDPRGLQWKLVYVDFENDVLLVGDDPWEEFVSCVRCIKILSPVEVQQMSQGGKELLKSSN